MNVYMTEEEQVEAIKRWWSKYGSYLMWAVALVLLAFSLYQWMERREQSINTHASEAFQRLMYADGQKDESLLKAKINDLKSNFSKTVYSDVAMLLEAKAQVEIRDFDKAIATLEQMVATKQGDGVLKELAKMRLARLYGETKQAKKAFALLSDLEKGAYAQEIMELKGDVLMQVGEKKEALIAYQKATELKANANDLPYLRYKLDRLQAALS
jgi:predicted negative regulator of RcsB-dependent stress response